MRSSRTMGTDLWREIVTRLDEGVIVLSRHGVVIYANDEAGRLLDYPPRDVLGLEKDDLAALCDPDRLDGTRFAAALHKDAPPLEELSRPYEIVTPKRRLRARLFPIVLEHGEVTILLLQELAGGHNDLIARTVSGEMRGPLDAIGHYSGMLLDRLKDGTAHPYEINDLARIIRDSLGRALSLWEMLANLQSAQPEQSPTASATSRVDLAASLKAAASLFEQMSGQPMPGIRADIPADLPAVRAAAPMLDSALNILLAAMAARLSPANQIVVSARNREKYVQIDLTVDAPQHPIHSHLMDTLPFATVEQMMARQGGRAWIKVSQQTSRVSLALPIWADTPQQPGS